MKTRIITTAAVVGFLAAFTAGDVFARGGGGGGGGGRNGSGQGGGTCTSSQTATGAASATRPVGSQRRDGTFLETGVTANGSTTRPNKGNGPQDGSRLATPATTTPTPAPAE